MSHMKISALLAVSIVLIGLLFSTSYGSDNIKILLIGIDGTDWEMIAPMTKSSELPNFMKLIKNGVSARMNTNDKGPSAVYWTSIATGQLSNKHGIKGFVIKDPETSEEVPYTSNMRKTKAFWNILSERNISVGVAGWFITWPAEKVNGFMVSSYYGKKRSGQPDYTGTFYKDVPDMVYPPEMQNTVESYVSIAQNNFNNKLKDIIRPSALKSKLKKGGKRLLQTANWILLNDEIYKEIGINLYKNVRPELFSVYFSGVDNIGHKFTRRKKKIHDRIANKFGNVHKNYYMYMDKILGEFINLADEKTIIIVLSDHGIMRGEHNNNGVFIVSGPNIKKNTHVKRPVNLTDVFPTILYLMGQPLASDMDGSVYEDAISEDYLNKHKIRFIDSYGKRKISDTKPIRSNFDEEILNRLKTLGYIN